MPLTRTVLYTGQTVSIRYVTCRSADQCISDVEYAEGNNLILPLRGAFIEHFSRSKRVLAEPNVALLFPAGRPAKVSHPLGGADDCLVMEFANTIFHEITESAGITGVGTHCLLTPSAMAWRNLLLRRIKDGLAGQLEIEETALAFLDHAVGNSFGNDVLTPRKSDKAAAHPVEMAKLMLLEHPELKWTLSDLARKVVISPFHLTRMFHKKVGVPLHRYQVRTRLARAIDLLLNTDHEITTIAFNLGFSSHSHFTAIFKKAVGLPPRKFRVSATSADAAKIRKILIAGFTRSF